MHQVGYGPRQDLLRLRPIMPSRIPDESLELKTYRDLLFRDVGTTAEDANRAASLGLILQTAVALGKRPDPEDIRWYLFDPIDFADDRLNRQRVCWEAYHCQDMYQVAAAALLELATELIAEIEWGRTLGEIKAEVQERLESSEPDTGVSAWSAIIGENDHEHFDYRSVWTRLTSRYPWRPLQHAGRQRSERQVADGLGFADAAEVWKGTAAAVSGEGGLGLERHPAPR